MARLVNAPEFELDELCGKSIQDLVGCTESDNDCAIEMLFLRISEDGIWHRLFLDAGIGFWETWTEEEAFSEYTDHRRIDFADHWGLGGVTILTAECFGTDLAEPGLSDFRIELTSGTLTFRYADVNDMESDTILVFDPKANTGTEQGSEDQPPAPVESESE